MKEVFGTLMREGRTALQITLRELALKVGCTPSYLSEVENGLRSAPKDDELVYRIASELHIPAVQALEAAKNDRERRDMKFIRDLFASDDQLAASYCRARETCSDDELKNIFKEIFEKATTSSR